MIQKLKELYCKLTSCKLKQVSTCRLGDELSYTTFRCARCNKEFQCMHLGAFCHRPYLRLIKTIIVVLIAAVSFSYDSHAVPFEVAYGRGKHGLNARTVRHLVRVSARRWSRETGLRIRIKRFYRYRSGPILPVMSLAEFSPGNLPYPGPTLVVLPPVLDSITTTRNDAWIYGHAVVCGSQGFVAVTNKDRFGRQHRLSHAKVAIAHELGHILGADHDRGLMDPAPLQQLESWGFRYEITDKSIREVRRCRR